MREGAAGRARPGAKGSAPGPGLKPATTPGFPPRHVVEDVPTLTCPAHLPDGASLDVVKEMSVVLGSWQPGGRLRTACSGGGGGMAGHCGVSSRGPPHPAEGFGPLQHLEAHPHLQRPPSSVPVAGRGAPAPVHAQLAGDNFRISSLFENLF